jgi:hypothetical protein
MARIILYFSYSCGLIGIEIILNENVDIWDRGVLMIFEEAKIIAHYSKKAGKTWYGVTNLHKGEIDLAKTLEELIIRKVLTMQREADSAEKF